MRHMDQVGLVDIELVEVRFASAKDLVATLSELSELLADSAESPSPLKLAADERSNSEVATFVWTAKLSANDIS